MQTTTSTTGASHKVRRDIFGGKRGDGNRRDRRLRRPSPSRIRGGEPDSTLTGVSGLVPFGTFVRELGVDEQLRTLFARLKDGPNVVYPMENQLRLLLDANVVGEQRVFGLEGLASDPLFVHLAGGVVPSLDTVYRDLCRFDELATTQLEVLMSSHGVSELEAVRGQSRIHVDVDTTVEPLFGTQEGAEPGPNPRYHGRPSFHPILAVVAETGSCVGARLRPGDTSLGNDDAKTIGTYINRVAAHVSPETVVTARIDSGGDCAEILNAVDQAGAFFIVKAKLNPELSGAAMHAPTWRTVDEDADGRPSTQVAELEFQRPQWRKHGKRYRVVAVRRTERDSGQQILLWPHLDYSVQVFITNDFWSTPEEIVADYDGRAEVESRIGDLKNGLGIGKIPSQDFRANHAAFLLKLLAHNLVHRYVRSQAPELRTWRMPWLWRALFRVPGRLVRSGRQHELRVPPGSILLRMLN